MSLTSRPTSDAGRLNPVPRGTELPRRDERRLPPVCGGDDAARDPVQELLAGSEDLRIVRDPDGTGLLHGLRLDREVVELVEATSMAHVVAGP